MLAAMDGLRSRRIRGWRRDREMLGVRTPRGTRRNDEHASKLTNSVEIGYPSHEV